MVNPVVSDVISPVIIVRGRIRQTVAYIFILPFKFNPSLYYKSLLLFHLIIMNVDDFDLIVTVINAANTITIQIDHSYVVLSMITHELLMMVIAVFKLFLMVFYSNFSLNIDENWFLYALLYEQSIVQTILLMVIIMICEFYVILGVLIYFNVEVNNTKTFQSPSNDSTNTIKSGSNDGQTTVQRVSNKGQIREHNTTQQYNIFEIIVWINTGDIKLKTITS